jgi:hypothetical protein
MSTTINIAHALLFIICSNHTIKISLLLVTLSPSVLLGYQDSVSSPTMMVKNK